MMHIESFGRVDRFPKHGKWPKVFCSLADDYVRAARCVAGKRAEKHSYCLQLQTQSVMRRETQDRKSRAKVTRSGPVSQRARMGDRQRKVTEHYIPVRKPNGRFRKGSGWHTDNSDNAAQHKEG